MTMISGGGHPRPHDGKQRPEPETGPGTPSGVSGPAPAGHQGDQAPVDPRSLRLAWVDLETTGLVPTVDRILEIGCLVTEHDLTPLDSGFSTVIHVPAADMPEMVPFVRDMHARSGLLDEVAASAVTAQEARAATLAYLSKHIPPGVVPVAGASVRHDRNFLVQHAPELETYLHYRIVDVSAIKEIARRWFPTAYNRRPRGANRHRSLTCIYDAIAELRYYRETVFDAYAA